MSGVDEYLATLPPDQRTALKALRETILTNLPEGYEEGFEFGMISYHVPLESYPDTYNGRPLGYLALGARKNYLTLHANHVYADPELAAWLKESFSARGKRLQMGKSCIRFDSLDQAPLDVIAELVRRNTPSEMIALYERSRR